MAGNNTIQILRTANLAASANRTQVLADGQPLYDKATGKLFIGDGSTQAQSLSPIRVGGIVKTYTNFASVIYNEPSKTIIDETTRCEITLSSTTTSGSCTPSAIGGRIIDIVVCNVVGTKASVAINYNSVYQESSCTVRTEVNIYLQGILSASTNKTYEAETLPAADVISLDIGSVSEDKRITVRSTASHSIAGAAINVTGSYTLQEIGVDENGASIANIDISGLASVTGAIGGDGYLFKGSSLQTTLGISELHFDKINSIVETPNNENTDLLSLEQQDGNIYIGYRGNDNWMSPDELFSNTSPINITIYGARIS